jgi:Fe-S cluster assembly protein SufB
MATESDVKAVEGLDRYKYGFSDPDEAVFKTRRGLNREVVEQISAMKGEPAWMLQSRLTALEHYLARPTPTWGPDLSKIDFANTIYYVRPAESEGKTWDDVPETIKKTFDKLGIPEAEQKFLAGVGAQYESEMVYHNIQKHLADQGVIFVSIEDGLKLHRTCSGNTVTIVIRIRTISTPLQHGSGPADRSSTSRRGQDRPAAAGVLPPQHGQYRPVRADADHRR